MRRHILWYALAAFWAAIAVVGFVHHHPGNAAVEGAVAVLFLIMGVVVGRRDRAMSNRYKKRQ